MAFTLVLGWWGVIAALLRNPYAIFVNTWALFAPPFGAGDFGAINVDDIRASAARDEERDQRLADVYMQMPGWMETLTDDDVEKILANVDYYDTLGVATSATHGEIKRAWRTQAKGHHPDHAGSSGHERMIEISDAWKVLGDERLRHAYDHRAELLAFLQDAEAASAFEPDDADDGATLIVGCTECRLGFESFDEAADHVDAVHPHTDYEDILVSLTDDEPDAPTPSSEPQWRCRACQANFADYDVALDHADRAHPDRLSIDPRSAVEAV
jgi:hypothetical protein